MLLLLLLLLLSLLYRPQSQKHLVKWLSRKLIILFEVYGIK